jgi:alkaline phosphatase
LLLALALVFSLFAPQVVIAATVSEDGTCKNVIFMIGDGMGENHLRLAVQEGYDLFMVENADLRGQSKTRSLSDSVTDSAAGATALACGVRNTNGCVGTYSIDPSGILFRPRNITENAIAHGMKTGIVTTDSTAGATPAGYSAHVKERGMAQEITDQQLASDIDFIWGAAVDATNREAVEAMGITYVSNKAELEALTPGERSFGQFSGSFWRPVLDNSDLPTLEELTVKAISLLNTDNENGFFLMVEGAHIDKNSHATTEDGTADYAEKHERVAAAVKGFDNAIKAAVEFAREDGNTLVVVTADHETGSLYLEGGVYRFHSGSHSGANVPLLVYCCNDLITESAAVPNRSIPGRIAEKLGWSKTEFPKADPGSFLAKLKSMLQRS